MSWSLTGRPGCWRCCMSESAVTGPPGRFEGAAALAGSPTGTEPAVMPDVSTATTSSVKSKYASLGSEGLIVRNLDNNSVRYHNN
jgi:hypothetical protein